MGRMRNMHIRVVLAVLTASTFLPHSQGVKPPKWPDWQVRICWCRTIRTLDTPRVRYVTLLCPAHLPFLAGNVSSGNRQKARLLHSLGSGFGYSPKRPLRHFSTAQCATWCKRILGMASARRLRTPRPSRRHRGGSSHRRGCDGADIQ